MFSDPLSILVLLAVLAVLGVLAVGIGGFAKGGEFNRKHGNKMMRWRIYAQAIALALVLLVIYLRGTGG